jgi:2-oxoglutarate dehydrogenase E1 component
MKQFQLNSYLFGGNASYVEELYDAYLNNPASVPENWRVFRRAAERAGNGRFECQRRRSLPDRRIVRRACEANAFIPRESGSNLATARKQVMSSP